GGGGPCEAWWRGRPPAPCFAAEPPPWFRHGAGAPPCTPLSQPERGRMRSGGAPRRMRRLPDQNPAPVAALSTGCAGPPPPLRGRGTPPPGPAVSAPPPSQTGEGDHAKH